MPLDSDYSDEDDYPKIQKTISDSSSLPLVLEVGKIRKIASERNNLYVVVKEYILINEEKSNQTFANGILTFFAQ
ncbi:8845_t:CDS:2 [Funneliformis mosseae]|uniref:8845_t:CDS:1 n=1 Tax=Funneliformis mosseae TaxID=27381 RepID=A0A9N9EMQ0_FUNMO|nr:8845_t:CDS:2 [Funneliformis mosseae]